MVETHVLTFTISKPFDEWVKTYDASQPLQRWQHHQPLSRGRKDDPTKVCAVMKAESGVMEAFIADNADDCLISPCWRHGGPGVSGGCPSSGVLLKQQLLLTTNHQQHQAGASSNPVRAAIASMVWRALAAISPSPMRVRRPWMPVGR